MIFSTNIDRESVAYRSFSCCVVSFQARGVRKVSTKRKKKFFFLLFEPAWPLGTPALPCWRPTGPCGRSRALARQSSDEDWTGQLQSGARLVSLVGDCDFLRAIAN